ncbi:MAG TPA: HD-GYP domain-containing protein [Gaiellaceae bacterium]|jgi:HD-GYP domain-containing protein (c-di-GMP phosphodiesterase class II)
MIAGVEISAAGLRGHNDGGDEHVRVARARVEQTRPEGRDLLPFAVSGGAVIVGAAVAAAVLGTGLPGSAWRALFFLALYAVATRVEFEVGSGISVPTEIVLVPMLFALPLGLVPTVCAAGFVVGSFADRPRALRNPLRAMPSIAAAAHSFGPVIVLSAANGLPLRWSAWPIYIGALAAQFGFDIVAAAIGTATTGVRPRDLARFVTYAYTVDASLAPLGLALAFATRRHAYLVVIALPLIVLLRMFAGERSRRIDNALELTDAYRGTAFLLGDVIEADDAYTGRHTRHVVELVLTVGSELGLSAEERRDAEFVAVLHDVGKIRVPKEILNKPGPLNPTERAIVETHTIEGERMLARIGGLLAGVGRIVRSCHEHWDGNGYPDKLAGERIPLLSRVVAVCDAFSAMTTDRPYRPAMPEQNALAELRRCAGTQFDPRVVDAFLSVVSDAG